MKPLAAPCHMVLLQGKNAAIWLAGTVHAHVVFFVELNLR